VTSSGSGSSLEARAGLCAHCEHARVITSDRGSHFLRCDFATIDPTYPKYPRLPVLSCPAFSRDIHRRATDRTENS